MKIWGAAHFVKFCLLLLEISTKFFEIWHQKILHSLLFLSHNNIEIFLGSWNLVQIFFTNQLLMKIISGQSKLFILLLTRRNCIDSIAEWPHLLTSSNCSHSKCVHVIWCQIWKTPYHATSCYILYNTTTQGPILHKVVGDCSTSIEALNLTPGDICSGGVHWSDRHYLWSSCTSKRAIYMWQYSGK